MIELYAVHSVRTADRFVAVEAGKLHIFLFFNVINEVIFLCGIGKLLTVMLTAHTGVTGSTELFCTVVCLFEGIIVALDAVRIVVLIISSLFLFSRCKADTLGRVDTKPKTHLFGRILRILRRENLPGDSPPAFSLLVCAEILLKNLRFILVSTRPRKRLIFSIGWCIILV